MRTRYLVNAVAITAVVTLSLCAIPNAASADTNEENAAEAFIVTPDALVPVQQDQLELSEGDAERVLVRFEVDDAGSIVSRELELQAPPLPDNDEGRDKLATFAADDQGRVELSWWDPSDGVIEWTVTRDGAPVSKVFGDHFVDHRPDASVESEYRIEGTKNVEVDGTVFSEPFSSIILVPGVDSSIDGRLSAGNSARSAGGDVQASVAARDINAGKMNFQVNTFIPNKFVNGPWNAQLCAEQWVRGGAQFGGDNRGFTRKEILAPSVRTGVDIQYTWSGPTTLDRVTNQVRTSGTKLYANDGTFLMQKKANLSNVKVWDHSGDEAARTINIIHSAADPMCVMSAPIWYNIKIYGENSGQYRFYGDHTQAPSYEFRVSINDGYWTNPYQFVNRGFEYLFPIAPRAHVDFTGRVVP